MRFFYNNYADLGATSITSSSEGSTLVAANVQHKHKSKIWRSAEGNDEETITFDLGDAYTVTSTVLLGHNYASGYTIKSQGNDSDAWGSPSVNETLTFDAGAIGKTFTGGSYQYWRVYVDKNLADPIGELDLGRVFIGAYITLPQPSHYNERTEDLSLSSRTVGGQLYSYEKPYYRVFNLEYNSMSETDYQLLKTLSETVGTHTPFFVQFDTTTPLNEYVYVRLRSMIGRQYSHATCGGTYYWRATLELEELV